MSACSDSNSYMEKPVFVLLCMLLTFACLINKKREENSTKFSINLNSVTVSCKHLGIVSLLLKPVYVEAFGSVPRSEDSHCSIL